MKLDLFYEKNKRYAVTIAPDDKIQFFGKPDRMRKFINHMNEQFISYTNNRVLYDYHIELSEPHCEKITVNGIIKDKGVIGNGPRLHLHGTLLFKTDKAVKWWLLYGMHSLLQNNMVTIKAINDITIWNKYCIKQKHIINHDPLSNSRGANGELTEDLSGSIAGASGQDALTPPVPTTIQQHTIDLDWALR